MLNRMIRTVLLCLAFSALGSTGAIAQPEPSMAEVYATAQSGQLDKAQTMIQQVLVSHPNSAKAHYVRAELFARQGKSHLAQESLQEAERLSPGLHFAKPESVSALKAQIAELGAHSSGTRAVTAPNTTSTPSSSTTPLPATDHNNTMWLVLGGGVVLLVALALRTRQTGTKGDAATAGGLNGSPISPYGSGGQARPLSTNSVAAPASSVLNGPQTFGHTAATPYPGGAPYPAAPTAPSMGSRIMGGVATGLAVGAGVMAAEAIGRRLMDRDEPGSHGHEPTGAAGSGMSGGGFTPLDTHATNADMGGDNFGVSDGGWDDGDSGGGSDWDN